MFQGLDISHFLSAALIWADNILFFFYMLTVGYLFIFAVGANLRRKRVYPKAKKCYRYAMLFSVDSKEMAIVESIKSFMRQDYADYELIVVSNDRHAAVNRELGQLPVNLMIMDAENYNKVESIKYAMANLDENSHDIAVIMDSDSEVEAGFLRVVNDAYYSGEMAIQTHRITRHLDSDIEIFGAVSEEINNSIFRRGHVNFGFSSALIGSGMAFNFKWLKYSIIEITNNDFEKQLEAKLLEQSIFIDYLNDVHVYGNKASKADEFYEERRTWQTSKIQRFGIILRKLIVAISRSNYDYCDKLLQWLMPSRMIIAGTLLIIAVVLLILSWTIALKWWLLLLFLTVTFSIALPDYLIDARFIKALRGAPILFSLTVFNSLRRRIMPQRVTK